MLTEPTSARNFVSIKTDPNLDVKDVASLNANSVKLRKNKISKRLSRKNKSKKHHPVLFILTVILFIQ